MPALAPLHMAIPAADGVILRGALTYPDGKGGSRYPLAVLAHQYPSTRDSFAPLCTDLRALGIATLAFDLRGQGESIWSTAGMRVADAPAAPTLEAFAAAFLASAAKAGFAHISDDIVRVAAWGMAQSFIDTARVLLVGSSVGATGALLAAPQLGSALRAVLAFGAAGAPIHGSDASQRIRENCVSLRVPMLLTSSENDPFEGGKNARTWAKGLSHIDTLIVPGAEHGMAIYYDVRSRALAFVRSAIGLRTGTAKARRTRGPRKRR